jgi:hypothetical protein
MQGEVPVVTSYGLTKTSVNATWHREKVEEVTGMRRGNLESHDNTFPTGVQIRIFESERKALRFTPLKTSRLFSSAQALGLSSLTRSIFDKA